MESGDWIRPIEKRSLSKVVMDSVRDGIISGEVKPGEFLPSESDLAMKFGVGKSSVREAMKMLEALGYIEVSKGNGYRVCTSVNPEIINPGKFIFEKACNVIFCILNRCFLFAADNAWLSASYRKICYILEADISCYMI